MMIWRDDDVGVKKTRLTDLRAVDDMFQRYGVPHTIAVVARGIDRSPDLINLIRERRMIVQLHCWEHDDLSVEEDARTELAMAKDLLCELFPPGPTILFPPWNRTSPELEFAAKALGLAVSTEKISLPAFIRARGDTKEKVINFHHWAVSNVIHLERALRVATKREAPPAVEAEP